MQIVFAKSITKKLLLLCMILSVFSTNAIKKTNKKHRAYKAKKNDQRPYLYTLLQARQTVRVIAEDLLEKGRKEGTVELSQSENLFNQMALVDRGLSFSATETDLIPIIGYSFYSPWSTDYLMMHKYGPRHGLGKHISDLFSKELSKKGFVIEYDLKDELFRVASVDGVQLKRSFDCKKSASEQEAIKTEELRLIQRYKKEITDSVEPFVAVRDIARIVTAYVYGSMDKSSKKEELKNDTVD